MQSVCVFTQTHTYFCRLSFSPLKKGRKRTHTWSENSFLGGGGLPQQFKFLIFEPNFNFTPVIQCVFLWRKRKNAIMQMSKFVTVSGAPGGPEPSYFTVSGAPGGPEPSYFTAPGAPGPPNPSYFTMSGAPGSPESPYFTVFVSGFAQFLMAEAGGRGGDPTRAKKC